jgi:peptide/nickel transport system permease protein
MIAYVARRVVYLFLVMVGAGITVCVLLAFVPDARLEASAMERTVDNLHTLFTLDFGGLSRAENFPLWEVLWDRGLTSLLLISGATFLLVLVGVGGVFLAVMRPSSYVLNGIVRGLRALSTMPILVWAFIFLMLSGALFGVFPNYNNLSSASGGEVLLIYATPILVLSLGDGMLSDLIDSTTGEVEREMGSAYVQSLWARGMDERIHVLRGITGPVIIAVSSKISYLIGGTIVVEFIFNFQGLAYQIYQSVVGVKDYPLVIAATMLFVVVVLGMHLFGEVVRRALDPRIAASGGAG